jgi:hypothetical protein
MLAYSPFYPNHFIMGKNNWSYKIVYSFKHGIITHFGRCIDNFINLLNSLFVWPRRG